MAIEKTPWVMATFLLACGAAPGAATAPPAPGPEMSRAEPSQAPTVVVEATDMQQLVTRASQAWQGLAFGAAGGTLELRLAPGSYTGLDLVLHDDAATNNVDIVLRGGPDVRVSGCGLTLGGDNIVVDGLVFEGTTSGSFLDLRPGKAAMVTRVAWLDATTAGGGMQPSHLLFVQAAQPGASFRGVDLWSVGSSAGGAPLVHFSSMNAAFGDIQLDHVALASPASAVGWPAAAGTARVSDSVILVESDAQALVGALKDVRVERAVVKQASLDGAGARAWRKAAGKLGTPDPEALAP